jgi:hypothetical protein
MIGAEGRKIKNRGKESRMVTARAEKAAWRGLPSASTSPVRRRTTVLRRSNFQMIHSCGLKLVQTMQETNMGK